MEEGAATNDYALQYFDGLGRVYRTEKKGPSAAIVTDW